MYKASDIAEYIILYCHNNNASVSNLKLQKIMYFIQANFLVNKNKPCFDDEIQALDFGPIIPEVYNKYKFYGGAIIPHILVSNSPRLYNKFDKKLIDSIIQECLRYSDVRLMDIIHHQTPWQDAYSKGKFSTITNDSLYEFFKD